MSNEAYDQKNNDDYEAITSALNIALIDLENNKKLKPTIAQLSKMTGIHRNTITNRGWPVQKLNQIKDIRKAEEKSRKEKKAIDNADVKNALEAKMIQAQNEVIYWFNEYQDIKRVTQHSDKRLQKMRESRDYYKTQSDTDKRSLLEARQEIKKLRQMLAFKDATPNQLMH